MINYTAFLRGINVGGHKKIKMADLRQMLSSLGFNNVKTLLASGNAVFEAEEPDTTVLTNAIEEKIGQTFGFEVNVMLRTIPEIEEIIRLQPFKDIEVDKNIRLYVSFFGKKLTSTLELPWESPDKDFRILQKTATEVFSVLRLSSNTRSVDSMAFIEKEFGKNGTTRNWNTVNKIAALQQEK